MSLIGNKLLDKVSDFNSLSKEFALKCIVIYTYFSLFIKAKKHIAFKMCDFTFINTSHLSAINCQNAYF